MKVKSRAAKPTKNKPIDVVIETAKGSATKYKLEPGESRLRLGSIMPNGAVFPYNFGFVPDTLADDGDPIDVLVLTDTSLIPGCIVPVRIIGVLKARQTEKSGARVRNDRLLAVATADPLFGSLNSYDQVGKAVLDDIAHFFASYNEARKVPFRAMGYGNASVANSLIAKARKAHAHRPPNKNED